MGLWLCRTPGCPVFVEDPARPANVFSMLARTRGEKPCDAHAAGAAGGSDAARGDHTAAPWNCMSYVALAYGSTGRADAIAVSAVSGGLLPALGDAFAEVKEGVAGARPGDLLAFRDRKQHAAVFEGAGMALHFGAPLKDLETLGTAWRERRAPPQEAVMGYGIHRVPVSALVEAYGAPTVHRPAVGRADLDALPRPAP